MKSLITGLLVSAMLVATAAAQSTANTQTSGTASSQTSVSASQSGVSADSNNSATASQDASASQSGQSGSASAKGSASQDTSANTNAVAIPSGTKIPAVLNKSVDSKKNKEGDEVTAKTAADVLAHGKVIIPRNTKLIGHVTEAKAKANGESESALGIVFDKAVMKNGQAVPIQASIQAIAAPAASAASSMGEEPMGAPSTGGGSAGPSGGGGGRGLGGAVGGATGAVANTAGSVGNAAGDVTGSAGSTVGSTAGAAGNTVGATGALSSASRGVVGLKGVQLSSDTSNTSKGSLLTSTGKNVKLDSGSQLVLNVTASGQNP